MIVQRNDTTTWWYNSVIQKGHTGWLPLPCDNSHSFTKSWTKAVKNSRLLVMQSGWCKDKKMIRDSTTYWYKVIVQHNDTKWYNNVMIQQCDSTRTYGCLCLVIFAILLLNLEQKTALFTKDTYNVYSQKGKPMHRLQPQIIMPSW